MRVARAFAVCCFVGMVYSPASGDGKPRVGPPKPLPELKIVRTIKTGSIDIDDKHFSPDSRILAGWNGSQAHFWWVPTGKKAVPTWEFVLYTSLFGFVDSNTVATQETLQGDTQHLVQLRAFPSGKKVGSVGDPKEILCDVVVGSGLIVAVTRPREGKMDPSDLWVRVWSKKGKKWTEGWMAKIPLETIEGNTDYYHSLAISPDGAMVAVSTRRGWIYLHQSKDGKLLRSISPEKSDGEEQRVTFSPDGRHVAVVFNEPLGVEVERRSHLTLWDSDFRTLRAHPRWEDEQIPYHCLFTPDGKTLIVPCDEQRVRLYETETGRLRQIAQTPRDPAGLTLSPNGRLLAMTQLEPKPAVLLLDWRAPTKKVPALDAAALERLWSELASTDSEKGFQAVVVLGSSPTQAAKLFSEKLKPVAITKADSVKAWIADLGSDDFVTREAAEKELAKLGNAIEPELKEAAKSEVPERCNRANRLLKAVSGRDNPERLRILRSIEVLEYIDTSAGRDILKELASGAPSALLTRDAKAALERLKAFDPKP